MDKDLKRFKFYKKDDSYLHIGIKKFNYRYIVFVSIGRYRAYLRLWDYR